MGFGDRPFVRVGSPADQRLISFNLIAFPIGGGFYPSSPPPMRGSPEVLCLRLGVRQGQLSSGGELPLFIWKVLESILIWFIIKLKRF